MNSEYVITDGYGRKSVETKPGKEGIVVTYRRGRTKHVYIRAYYDTMVGMEGLDLTLGEFCRALGITLGDVRDALDT